MAETFIALFFAHTLADFVFQTNWMVANKRNPLVLGLHGLIVYAAAVVATGSVHPGLLALALVHIGIDVGKLILSSVWTSSKGLAPFLIDQALHLLSLVALTLWLPDLWALGLWAPGAVVTGEETGILGTGLWSSETPLPVTHLPAIMVLLSGLILSTRAGGFLIGLLMEPFAPHLAKGDAGRKPARRGPRHRACWSWADLRPCPFRPGARRRAAYRGEIHPAVWRSKGRSTAFGIRDHRHPRLVRLGACGGLLNDLGAVRTAPAWNSALDTLSYEQRSIRMFGIPGKAAVTLTPSATRQIAQLMQRQSSQRVAHRREEGRLRGDGIHDGVCILGQPAGRDRRTGRGAGDDCPDGADVSDRHRDRLETGLIESGFKFRNPNVVEACGCGESIKFRDTPAA